MEGRGVAVYTSSYLFEDLACRYGLDAKAGSPANDMGTKLFGPTYAYIIYILYHVSYDEYNSQLYHAQGFIQEGGGGGGFGIPPPPPPPEKLMC